MYSPRSEASDGSHASDATFVDSVRDSIFSSAFANSFTFRSLPHPTGSVYTYASSRAPDGNGDAVVPNFTHPYLTEPVNPRESRSYRRHADSVLFPIPPSNVYGPAQSQASPPTHRSAITEPQAQQHNQPSFGHYVEPYINQIPVDYLNSRRPHRSFLYRETSQESLHDVVNKEDARRMALDALEGRRPNNTAVSSGSSGLVGRRPDESEDRPVHPPVYPQSVLPVNAFEYPSDRDGAWQVNEPVTIIRQERTRTFKAHTPEVVRIDERSEGRDKRSPRSVPDRAQGRNTPHPEAVHHQSNSATEERYHRHGGSHRIEQAPRERSQQGQPAETQFHDRCKVRRLDITANRHSTWMKGRVIRPFYLDPVDGADQSYYFVEFNHPTLGRQEGWFFENRREIKFKKQ